MRHGSFFKQMKRAPYELFLADCKKEDLQTLQEKLVIISYDRVNRTSVFSSCTNTEQIIDSIHASSRFPGLFDVKGIEKVDGTFASTDHILLTSSDPWLYIDLQNTLGVKTTMPTGSMVYSPCISHVPILNEVTCLLSNRVILDYLIKNGKDDARACIVQHAKNCIRKTCE